MPAAAADPGTAATEPEPELSQQEGPDTEPIALAAIASETERESVHPGDQQDAQVEPASFLGAMLDEAPAAQLKPAPARDGEEPADPAIAQDSVAATDAAPDLIEQSHEPEPLPAAATQPESAAVELEIEPLVVIPLAPREVAADAWTAELELEPIPVEPLFAPSSIEPAAAAAATEALGPATTAAEPEHAASPATTATAEATEIEVPPLAATPVEEVAAKDDAPHALELDPMAVEVPPGPALVATSMMEPSGPLSDASSPDVPLEPATATVEGAAIPAPAETPNPEPAASLTATAEPAADAAEPVPSSVADAPIEARSEEADLAPSIEGVTPENVTPGDIAPTTVAETVAPSAAEPVPDLPAEPPPDSEPIAVAADHPAEIASQSSESVPEVAAGVPFEPIPAVSPVAEPLDTVPDDGALVPPMDTPAVAAVDAPAVAPDADASPELQPTDLSAASEPSQATAAPAGPAQGTDMLSAAWESAVAREDADVDAVAAPPATDPPATIVEAEPADFLLEPLPLPDAASSPPQPDATMMEPAPAEPAADAILEIEEELFVLVPDVAAPDAIATQPLLPPEPVAAPVPQPPAASAGTAAASIAVAAATPPRPIAKPMPRPAPNDPLAALRAMSDEERIAVFS
jgi:hypothetical protein